MQMFSWTSIALLLAAAAGAEAQGCGDLKWACCDIPDNDPNGGTCRDDTLMTCWEGTCKRCGTDGMPVCAGAPSPSLSNRRLWLDPVPMSMPYAWRRSLQLHVHASLTCFGFL